MPKLHYSDLSSTTIYYLNEFAESYKIDAKTLEDLFLSLLDNEKSAMKIEIDKNNEKAYELGKQEGYDEGYATGASDKADEFLDIEANYVTIKEHRDSIKRTKESGYKEGYIDAIQWLDPKYDRDNLKKYL
jgi:hypothetical protein